MRKHCCKTMKDKINFKCEQHEDPFECPEHLIYFLPKFDEYGLIIHDGGQSFVQIEFCPWCGVRLPKSKREIWFDTLEELGFDNPLEDDIPVEFKTDQWYRNK